MLASVGRYLSLQSLRYSVTLTPARHGLQMLQWFVSKLLHSSSVAAVEQKLVAYVMARRNPLSATASVQEALEVCYIGFNDYGHTRRRVHLLLYVLAWVQIGHAAD